VPFASRRPLAQLHYIQDPFPPPSHAPAVCLVLFFELSFIPLYCDLLFFCTPGPRSGALRPGVGVHRRSFFPSSLQKSVDSCFPRTFPLSSLRLLRWIFSLSVVALEMNFLFQWEISYRVYAAPYFGLKFQPPPPSPPPFRGSPPLLEISVGSLRSLFRRISILFKQRAPL